MPDLPTRTELRLRRRPSLSKVVRDFNTATVSRLMSVPGFWNPEKSTADAPFYFGEGASLDLRKPLCAGLKGQIFYVPRFAVYLERERAMYDDFMRIFMANPVDYPRFCFDVLPPLITAFGAYRGEIELNQTVGLADFDARRARNKELSQPLDSRNSICRIWPVSYADDQLCRRAFGLTAAEVVRHAGPGCERAELLAGGALLVVTTEIVTDADALDEIDARVKNLLRS